MNLRESYLFFLNELYGIISSFLKMYNVIIMNFSIFFCPKRKKSYYIMIGRLKKRETGQIGNLLKTKQLAIPDGKKLMFYFSWKRILIKPYAK